MDNRHEYLTEKKREEIVSLVESSGVPPDIARTLTDKGLIDLEKRLEEREVYFYKRNRVNREPGNLPPVKVDDLPKDQGRVNKMEIEKLEKQEKDYILELAYFESQIDAIREDGEDRTAELEQTKMRMQDKLRQKREEIARLKAKR